MIFLPTKPHSLGKLPLWNSPASHLVSAFDELLPDSGVIRREGGTAEATGDRLQGRCCSKTGDTQP